MATEYTKVGSIDEVSEDGDPLIVEIDGKEIAVFRIKGEYHALLNYCVHQAGPLCEGPLEHDRTIPDGEWMWETEDEAKIVKCPWHAWRFDVTTGKSVDNEKYKTPTYDVMVEDSEIFVKV